MAEPEISLPVTADDLHRGGLPENMKMAPGLAIYFVDSLYQRCKAVAMRMSEARGMVGAHLINNPGACMAIISRSITWNLDPFAVAQATYEVKGKIGYEGKLCQAILENSGAIDGQLKFEFFGDWDKLRGKFKMVGTVGSGERKPQQLWTDEDEVGLGVKVSAMVKGEATAREEEFFLAEMYPRNSTLWILRPKQQMRYATARAFGNIAVPGIIMGIPFDVDPSGMGGDAPMKDITPERPQASEFRQEIANNPALAEWITKANFANTLGELAKVRADGLKALSPDVHVRFEEVCDARGRAMTNAQPQNEDEAGEAQASSEPPTEGARAAASEDDPTKGETPFQRGQRLLGIVKVPGDVLELHNSISEELKGKKDKLLWKGTCQARFEELGGVGMMTTVPK